MPLILALSGVIRDDWDHHVRCASASPPRIHVSVYGLPPGASLVFPEATSHFTMSPRRYPRSR